MHQNHPSNRLAGEKSPYLLQHARNPVDWYPWGDEAFEAARSAGKFVLLSVGYSTCHWCHVMERESFEDREVAAVLQEHCVAVKVDREERPDVDQVYMAVCQAMTGRGGWPLTVLLTPERVPFFAGTYFPKESRHGRMGLLDLVRRAGALWRQDPAGVTASGWELLRRLREASVPDAPGEPLGPRTFAKAEAALRGSFDAELGGFGAAPKFPTPHQLTFLLRRHRATGSAEPLHMADVTLRAMARGGLFDHLGYGFHRYSTDARWLLPHFEKMLYDQAGLATAYLEAYQATGNAEHAETARRVFTYVLRDLTSPDGAFYSAEDADSEGVEGKFYVWEASELSAVLGPEDGPLFARAYGAAEGGNYREESSREPSGKNVLHLPWPPAAAVETPGLAPSTVEARLASCRERLFRHREGRVRPHRDDKILAGWNGLMVSAFARGAAVLGEPAYAAAATRAADAALSALLRDGRLLRRYRDGEAAIPGFAEDYAFVARGLLDVYGATFEPGCLGRALRLSADLWRLFRDGDRGGLFDTASDAEALVTRPKEGHDGATPSANSVALEVFARLWHLTGDPTWEEAARSILAAFGAQVDAYPAAFTQFLQGAALLLAPTRQAVVVGVPGAPETEALLAAARRPYAPELSVLLRPEGEAGEIPGLAPFTAAMAPVGGRAAAYVCEGSACRAPLTDPAALEQLLRAPPRG